MRFCTAYFAVNPGKDVVLNGSARMKKRPIGPLVDALNALGAEVIYREKKGFPPLHISGKRLDGGHVSLDASESSQFATALLLIAPALPDGLKLELKGQLASQSYLEMTLDILEEFGVKHQVSGNTISVGRQPILPRPYTVESDWSSAAYWYGIASLFDGAQIDFPHLYEESLQGDSMIRDLAQKWFGISTAYDRQKAWIAKSAPVQSGELHLDMLSTPDLIPTIITMCCLHKIPFTIQGISTLRHKESDRAEALKIE
jgi:3-phosphoshikimate 1-carboxyvinyltransferase